MLAPLTDPYFWRGTGGRRQTRSLARSDEISQNGSTSGQRCGSLLGRALILQHRALPLRQQTNYWSSHFTDALRAPVRPTSARIAFPPNCVGHIDRKAQANLRSLLRSATPKRVLPCRRRRLTRQTYLFRAVKPTTSGGGTSGTYGRAVANW
jgi:hypothetical protein